MNNMNISYEALRCIPVRVRDWFTNRIARQIKKSMPKDQYGLDDDTPINSSNN